MDHVARAFPDDVVALPFSYRTALIGRWDVFQVHWPESILRHADVRRRTLRRALFALLLLRLVTTRAPVVRTVHNLRPHERGPWLERWLLRRLDARVGTWVRLNPVTETPGTAPAVTIPHGHYERQLGTTATGARPVADAGRLLFFGFIRPYKGVEELVEVFRSLPDDGLRLTVAGKPATDVLRATVESAAAGDARIDLRLEFIPDLELGELVTGSTVVVLPYRDMHNSGAIFAALSGGRPVLVQHNAVTTALQEEVGRDWVQTFVAPLDADDLRRALSTAAERDPSAAPDLTGRSWPEVAARYVDVYRALTTKGAR
jgi:beta-1,4-mannosyltransferase